MADAIPRRRRRTACFSRLFAALLLAATGCGSGEPTTEARVPGTNDARWSDAPYVVLVSFDGFAWDLMDRHPAPSFARVGREGVRAERMIPTFPTKTFPTHYSIATGMYAEHHGLVGNRFWAAELEGYYSLSDRSVVEDGRWYRGEPIWVTAERQGMVAASFFFVGTEADVGGVRPSHWRRFDAAVPNDERVDQALAWLAMPLEQRPHLVTLYFEDVDIAAHYFGNDAPETAEAVAEVDRSLGRLLDGIDALPQGAQVYVVLVSDHGLMSAPPTNVAELDMTLFPGVTLVTGGPYASLVVEEGGPDRAPAVRDSLRALLPDEQVWLREEVPERFHYSADPRIGDIVVLAEPGRRVVAAGRPPPDVYSHGWDNLTPEMGAIFLARGPGIAPGGTIPPFESVHVYPFLAHLLGVTPSPEIDGSLDVLGPIVGS